MWRRNIVQAKRDEIKNVLEEKLFCVDSVFGDILKRHREDCKNMEYKYRIIDMK